MAQIIIVRHHQREWAVRSLDDKKWEQSIPLIFKTLTKKVSKENIFMSQKSDQNISFKFRIRRKMKFGWQTSQLEFVDYQKVKIFPKTKNKLFHVSSNL